MRQGAQGPAAPEHPCRHRSPLPAWSLGSCSTSLLGPSLVHGGGRVSALPLLLTHLAVSQPDPPGGIHLRELHGCGAAAACRGVQCPLPEVRSHEVCLWSCSLLLQMWARHALPSPKSLFVGTRISCTGEPPCCRLLPLCWCMACWPTWNPETVYPVVSVLLPPHPPPPLTSQLPPAPILPGPPSWRRCPLWNEVALRLKREKRKAVKPPCFQKPQPLPLQNPR